MKKKKPECEHDANYYKGRKEKGETPIACYCTILELGKTHLMFRKDLDKRCPKEAR